MAAGVHPAVVTGGVDGAGFLMDPQSIDIRPECDVPPGPAPVQNRHHIGAEKRRQHLQIQPGQPFPDGARSLELRPRHLRNPVQGVAEFDDSGEDFRKSPHHS